MTSTTTKARPSEREVPIPYREVEPQVVGDPFPVPMAFHRTSSKGGGRKFYPNIEGLRLLDGTERFRCKAGDCQHTYSTWGKVRSHIGRDHPNPVKAARRARKATAASATTADALPLEPAADTAVEVRPDPAPPGTAVEVRPAEVVDGVVVPSPDTPLTETGLDGLVATFGALASSRNEWRERAETAEKLAVAEKERAERAEAELTALQKRLRKLIEG